MRMMKSTMIYEKWDIVLLPFPFTDLTSSKKRPALIVSPKQYNSQFDVIVAFITSKMDLDYREGDYRILNWEKANLPKPSMLRMKLATIDKAIILKQLGVLVSEDRENFTKIIQDFFS